MAESDRSESTGWTESTQDVIDILTTDHREMVELIAQIERTFDAEQRRDLADTVIAEVMRHAVAEEMYVYPAVEQHVPGGKEEVAHDKEEHAEIVTMMKEIEGIDASSPALMVGVRKLELLLRHPTRSPGRRRWSPPGPRVGVGGATCCRGASAQLRSARSRSR